MKVQVDMVMDGCELYDLPMPIPDSDVQKLGQAIGNFVQWEIRFVVLRQVYICVLLFMLDYNKIFLIHIMFTNIIVFS